MGKPDEFVDVDLGVEQHQQQHQEHVQQPGGQYRSPSPSLSLLFSYCTRQDIIIGLVPGVTVSLVAGGVAPFMTHVLGQAFDAMATFTTSADHASRDHLMHTIRIVSLELLALALGALILNGLMATLWLWLGERAILRVRSRVFTAVAARDIEWFDMLNDQQASADGESGDSVGAGGLMAKFARDTDDVRMAIATSVGYIIEHTATFFCALILALVQSWSLSLVILSSIPAVVFVQIVSQAMSAPALNAERASSTTAATRLERMVASIATVKAFNAAEAEVAAVSRILDHGVTSYRRCLTIWGVTGGFTGFVTFAMFVQGFWYGLHLAHAGKITVGTVMGVFWACVIAGTNLQLIMPSLITLTKGKNAMVSLEEMIHPPPSSNPFADNDDLPTYDESVSTARTLAHNNSTHGITELGIVSDSNKSSSVHKLDTIHAPLQPIRPSRCLGTFDIPTGLTFSYLSRPDAPPALSISTEIHVSGPLTFFVGGSGSGKTTLAQILCGMYRVERGKVLMNEVPIEKLDKSWVKENVALVSQECLVFDMSVHENVALGRLTLPGVKDKEVTRAEVEEACQVAMVHDFVKDLPEGYDTVLGSGGANLSGGQKQRVALARAILRNPKILILDEATSALDPTSRVLVFQAIKHYRRHSTTIVITHDLSQVEADDYVYVMKNGRVVEEGFRNDLELKSPSTNDSTEIRESEEGEFRRMWNLQLQTGGYLPTRDDVVVDVYQSVRAEANEVVERVLSPDQVSGPSLHAPSTSQPLASTSAVDPYARPTTALSKRQTILPGLFGTQPWQLDAIHDIIGPLPSTSSAAPTSDLAYPRQKHTSSSHHLHQPYRRRGSAQTRGRRRPSTLQMHSRTSKNVHQSDVDRDDESLRYEDEDDDATIRFDEDDSYILADYVTHHRAGSTSSLPSPPVAQNEFGAMPGFEFDTPAAALSRSVNRRSMNFEPRVHSSFSNATMVASPTSGKQRFSYQNAVAAAKTIVASPAVHQPNSVPHSPLEDPDAFAYVVDENSFAVDDGSFDDERQVLEETAKHAATRRQRSAYPLRPTEFTSASNSNSAFPRVLDEIERPRSFSSIVYEFWPTVPNKLIVIFGLFVAAAYGAIAPLFSYCLARLMGELGANAGNTSGSTKWGLMVLFLALADGVSLGTKFYILEDSAMRWVASLRKKSIEKIMKQDKNWFDDSRNSPEKMVQIIMKDGDDARTLLATIAAQCVSAATMLGLGIGWALVIGWQLTLVGLAIAPIFGVVMAVQSHFAAKFELRNKRARDEVARQYFESVANVRAIRSMGLEGVFQKHFDQALEDARRTGVGGTFVYGLTAGTVNALIYAAEALLFFVGAMFMAHGTYSYLRLVEVLNLVVFTVSIGGQMMSFVPLIAKSKQAAADFSKVLRLDTTSTNESRGLMRVPVSGDVFLDDVHFSYPSRSHVPVLSGFSAKIRKGECVAIVGASGSGKSTIASLLQRLYEPGSGRITIGGWDIADTDVTWLRDHVAVVSQNPVLFDTSIAENIAYGSEPDTIPMDQIEAAARDAQIHDFIATLPNGYETTIGEKAALLSGGQAQRLSIARALAKRNVDGQGAEIMVFDEITSALDLANQELVMKTIMGVKEGKTTIMVTHKIPVMQMCDRILVVDQGRLVEQGTYDELIRSRGIFAQLASGGEWAS